MSIGKLSRIEFESVQTDPEDFADSQRSYQQIVGNVAPVYNKWISKQTEK